MYHFTPLIFIFLSIVCSAQIQKANLGVNGFTCSLCARTVQKSLEKLDFVKDVNSDLNNNTFDLTFASSKKVDIKRIGRQVMDAGYSVRFIKIQLPSDVQGKSEFDIDHTHFVVLQDLSTKGATDLWGKVIAPDLIERSEYGKWRKRLAEYKDRNKETTFIIIH